MVLYKYTPKNLVLSFLMLLALSIVSNDAFAQVSASAVVDRDTIKIGEQVKLDLTVEYPKEVSVEWPKLLGNVGDFEIINNSVIETGQSGGNTVQRQQINLTIFEEGYYAIPGIVFKYTDNKRIKQTQTDGIMVTVQTMQVDTAKGIVPIKGIIEVPLTWQDIAQQVLKYWAMAVALFLLLYFLYRRFAKKETEEEKESEIQIPPDEWALEKLKEVEKAKLWEQGQTKEYYSNITDVLREYIEKRFDVPALESTTDEIMSGLNKTAIPPSLKPKLQGLLTMADLVKFAKGQPNTDQHKQSLKDAYVFVNHSKNVGVVEEIEQNG